MLDVDQIECQRTFTHPVHTISTGPTPLPIEQWFPLQDPEDKPSNMMRVPKEEMKKNLNGCLTKCDHDQYNNIRDYLPAIAFAHNMPLILQLIALPSKPVTAYEREQ